MRTVLAVVASLALTAALVFAMSIAPWLAFGVDGVLQPASYDGTLALDAYSLFVSFLGAVAGGRLCAAWTRSRKAVIALAILSSLGGAANAAGHFQKKDPGPRPAGVALFEAVERRKEALWFTLLIPCLGVSGVLLGGRRAELKHPPTP